MTDVLNDHGEQEYRGHTIHVRRVDVDSTHYARPTPYEFELLIDGELITTSTQIERNASFSNPWADALFKYGHAYIDGNLADSLEDN